MNTGKVKTSINIVGQCLILSLPTKLSSEIIAEIRNDVLVTLSEFNINGVVVDLSSLKLIDSFEFNEIIAISKMIELMGQKIVFSGIQPAIVTTIIDMEIELGDINSFRTLENGLDFIQQQNSEETEEETEEDAEEDIDSDSECDDENNQSENMIEEVVID